LTAPKCELAAARQATESNVGQSRGSSTQVAFVMEQTLGHSTYAHNLRDVLDEQGGVGVTWLSVPFEAGGVTRFIPLLRGNWSIRAGWRARRTLRTALAESRHDAVFFHTQVTALFSVAVMRRLPSVISLDATPINYDSVGKPYGHRPAGRGFLDRQKHRINRQAFHAAVGLVTWSNWARRSLFDDYGVDSARVRVIPPGAAGCFFELGERRAAGGPAPTRSEPVRLLFVGSDFRRKGGADLLACLQGPLSERCQLDLVTQEAPEPSNNVRIHRDVRPNSPELTRLFAAADIFVLPSLADCSPMALMEASAAALPVVTTDVGALGEMVIDRESGFIVRPGDRAALRHALDTLVADADLRPRIGRAALAVARRKFDAGRNGRALLDFVIGAAQAGSTRSKVA
jgi:glycosyltransferase involved in cell wall biosynthesis